MISAREEVRDGKDAARETAIRSDLCREPIADALSEAASESDRDSRHEQEGTHQPVIQYKQRCRKKCSLVEGLSSGDQPRAIAWQLETSDPGPLEREVKKKDNQCAIICTSNPLQHARRVSHVIIKRDTRSFEKHCRRTFVIDLSLDFIGCTTHSDY
jgi:hypothetical protein